MHVKIETMQDSLKMTILYFLYFGLLWVGYYLFVVPYYGQVGFVWEPNTFKIIVSVLVLFLTSLVIPTDATKPSSFFLQFQMLLPILPMLVMFGAEDLPGEYMFLVMLSFILLISIVKTGRIRAFRTPSVSTLFLSRLLLVIAACYIFLIIAFGGLSFINTDFNKVYDLRNSAASNLPSLFAYFSPLVSKVILPFSLILAVDNKRWFIVIMAVTCSFMMFALTNHKAPLFYPFAAFSIYLLFQRKKPFQLLLFGLIALSAIALSSSLIIDDFKMPSTLFFHRLNFVPAQLNFYFFDYFSSNSYVLWAESKITFGLVEYAYDQPTIFLIGDEYFSFYGRKGEVAANTGWLGSGYMNFGAVGMLLYATVIGFIMKIIDGFGAVIGAKIVAAIMIAPMMALLLSADLPNSILTHGVLLAIVIMLMVKRIPRHVSYVRG